MLVEAFQGLVRGTVKVSEQELWNRYVLDKEQVDLEVFVVNPVAFEAAVPVGDADLRAYFEGHSDGFLTPERLKAAYVFVAPEPYRDQVKVYTGDIEEYYDSHIEEFSSPEELRLRHILLRVPVGADASLRQEKRETLEALSERVRKGEDFAELAKIYSEDHGSKEQGGDLGYVRKGKLVPEVEEAAFSLKPGEVSGVVTSSYGVHLLKVEDYRASRVEPLDGVQERIRETLTEEKAWRLARRKAEEYFWDVKEKGALPETGSSAGEFVVKETGYFSKAGTIPGLGQEESLKQVAFSLEPGRISEVTKGERGYYILQVIERKEPEVPPFEEVRDRVEKQVRREESRDLAREKAEQILELARSGTSSEELTKQEGVKSLETGFFSRLRTHVPRIGASEELLESAFALTEQDPWPKKVFEVNGKFYVFRLKERKGPTQDAFLAEIQELRKEHEQEKAQQIFREWLSELRKQQEVKINVVGT